MILTFYHEQVLYSILLQYKTHIYTYPCIIRFTDIIKAVDKLVFVGVEALGLFQPRCSLSSTVHCFTGLVNNLHHTSVSTLTINPLTNCSLVCCQQTFYLPGFLSRLMQLCQNNT